MFYGRWVLKVDDKGRICLPVALWREFSLKGRKVVLVKKRKDCLMLHFPPPAKPAKKIGGTIPWTGITVEAAEQLYSQGVAVETDGDKKTIILKSE